MLKEPHADLEAWEQAVRTAALHLGASCLSSLLEQIGSGRRDQAVICECGVRMESRGLREKVLVTILGEVSYKRSVFQCPSCKKTRCPGDEELDVCGTSRSPGLRRFMARAGSKQSFKEAGEDLRIYAGVNLSAKDIERVSEKVGTEVEIWECEQRKLEIAKSCTDSDEKNIPIMYISADGTGVPMIKRELEGRKGKQPDGSGKTREAKLGCVFTQTTTVKNERAVRDPDSTSFVGAIEGVEPFGWRLYGEALRRGLMNAEKVVVIGDAAKWIGSIVETHFPEAIHIVDLYHAKEHVAKLCKLLFDNNPEQAEQKRSQWWDLLDKGSVENIIEQAEQHWWSTVESVRKEARAEITFLENNKARMRYADFKAQGLFVGSGVIEAGCKSLIGQRFKQSGMRWSLPGANSIIAIRCLNFSDRFNDYWDDRAA